MINGYNEIHEFISDGGNKIYFLGKKDFSRKEIMKKMNKLLEDFKLCFGKNKNLSSQLSITSLLPFSLAFELYLKLHCKGGRPLKGHNYLILFKELSVSQRKSFYRSVIDWYKAYKSSHPDILPHLSRESIVKNIDYFIENANSLFKYIRYSVGMKGDVKIDTLTFFLLYSTMGKKEFPKSDFKDIYDKYRFIQIT